MTILLTLILDIISILIYSSIYALAVSGITYPIWNYVFIEYFTYIPAVNFLDLFCMCLDILFIINIIFELPTILFEESDDEEEDK